VEMGESQPFDTSRGVEPVVSFEEMGLKEDLLRGCGDG